jgi:anti-sigma regulatory factor (Ser/Thr protein kinase)
MADSREAGRRGRDAPGGGVADRSMAVFSRDVESASDARRWLGEFLDQHGIDGRLGNDATLVVSVLVTNALLFGAGATVLRATVSDDALQLAVTDSADALPAVRERDADTIGGLGLVIVGQLCREWGVSPFPGGKTVWATLSR